MCLLPSVTLGRGVWLSALSLGRGEWLPSITLGRGVWLSVWLPSLSLGRGVWLSLPVLVWPSSLMLESSAVVQVLPSLMLLVVDRDDMLPFPSLSLTTLLFFRRFAKGARDTSPSVNPALVAW